MTATILNDRTKQLPGFPKLILCLMIGYYYGSIS